MLSLQSNKSDIEFHIAHDLKESFVMPFINYNLPISEVKSKLDYNSETGVFTWKISPARNIKIGKEAGCVKSSRTKKNGQEISYRYIRLGHEIPAARMAWAIHYSEWPLSKILFVDGDTLNLRIDNLKEANSLIKKYDHSDQDQRKAYLKEHRETFPKVWKNSYLNQAFGISLSDYSRMVDEQHNKCAICDQKETETRGGKVKALSVDHDHTTGKVRALLCTSCNQMIGKAKENRNILLAAIDYLDKHNAVAFNPKGEA